MSPSLAFLLWLLLFSVVNCHRTTPLTRGPRVWVVDDGERIGRHDGPSPLMLGRDNPVWAPGQPVRLFALPGETVALQVVVTAGTGALSQVRVDLPPLHGPSGAELSDIERFVTHDVPILRRSGGKTPGESLGWERGAMPDDADDSRPAIPDPLIPIALAPPWADYPMTVPAGEQRVVWIDITIPERGAPAGDYGGRIQVLRAGGDDAQPLSTLAIELRLGAVPLPYAAARTMVYYDPQEIAGRTHDPAAVRSFLQLMHRHHLSPVYRINSAADVREQRAQLTGSLFTAEADYRGPGMGLGADVIAVGTYGTLGPPTAARVAQVREVLRELGNLGVLARDPDLFLYAVDEQCESGLGPAWRAALKDVPGIKIGHTCARDPATQPVDLVMVPASAYDPARAEAARKLGKRVWIYNGSLPHTGSFLLDGGALSLRANGWIQARFHIERWFYWEATFWNDDNPGGLHQELDPYFVAETFHNRAGDHANGDGVLVYPGPGGQQGIIASYRLKQWRRGICDAGYLQILRQRKDAQAALLADRIATALIGKAFPRHGAPYSAARRQLFEIITGKPPLFPRQEPD